MTREMGRPGRRGSTGALLRAGAIVALALVMSHCATAPPVPPAPPPPTFAEKMSWILRLEDQRVLRDPVIDEAPVVTLPARQTAIPPPPRLRPDLVMLLQDAEARLRRRAALAIGRVGLPEGVRPLAVLLAGDPEEEVRRMAAFALGLIGAPTAVDALTAALADVDPIVRGRAAEALAAIGAAEAATAIGEMVGGYVTAAFPVPNEDLSYPLAPEVEAFRLGLYALARLKAFEPIASAVLEEKGQPILWWWPVAYALQRVEDPRALPALITLSGVEGTIGVAFAAQGLGALGDPRGIDALAALLDPSRRAPPVMASAIRALGRIDDPRAGEALFRFVKTRDLSRSLRRDTVEALAAHPAEGLTDVLLELVTHSWPPLRAAAWRSLARTDPQTFTLVLSTLDPDPDWRVRAALADALAVAERDLAVYRLSSMLEDRDHRVLPAVLTALAGQLGPEAAPHLLTHLAHDDVVVRKTAATLLGQVKPEGSVAALVQAYDAGRLDSTYLVRAAVLEALVAIDPAAARETLEQALADPDWAVRVRAASLLEGFDAESDYQTAIRPAPTRLSAAAYQSGELVDPTVSPHVYLDTEKGTIEIELAVLDAPLTALNVSTLARAGFFRGLTFHRVVPNFVVQGGDPRSDGEGGPGYTVRDELNDRPYLRGTVGMALDWEDTGGSQFFITHSPQPHLEGRYTVFGQVVAGLDVVDRLEEGDLIRSALVWDGVNPLQP